MKELFDEFMELKNNIQNLSAHVQNPLNEATIEDIKAMRAEFKLNKILFLSKFNDVCENVELYFDRLIDNKEDF